jgi:hypothetical protein
MKTDNVKTPATDTQIAPPKVAKTRAPKIKHAPAVPAPRRETFKTLVVIGYTQNEEEIRLKLWRYVNNLVHLFATGTQKSDILDLLGIDNRRSVFVCTVKTENVINAEAALQTLGLDNERAPIAFTIDIDGFAGVKSMMKIEEIIKGERK